jgi:hypothetical protein
VTNRIIFGQIKHFLIFILIQVVIFRQMAIFGIAFPFPYLAFLLLLPIEISAIWALIFAFASGIFVDVFYDTLGIHASASVLAAFVRKPWMNLITPAGGYETVSVPKVQQTGFGWFLTYSIPIILMHHLMVFFLEGGLTFFVSNLIKAVFSTLLTGIMIIILQYLFLNRERTG